MFTKREDGRLRVPSPAVTRRHFRSHDTRAAFSDDHFFDPRRGQARDDHFSDPRRQARDPSPGSVGRMSTSAPTGGNMSPFFNRRYRDQRYSDHMDNVSYVTSASNYATSTSSKTREPSPKHGRMTSSAQSFVNGDAGSQSSRSRPRSFPEQRGTYLSEPSGHHGYAHYPKGRDLSPGYGYGKGQSGQGYYYDEVSPNSDEASSSATMTAEGVATRQGMLMGMEMAEGSFTSDDGYTWHSALTCYLCGQLFRRPRILPCGHTFCSECLAQLKDESMRESRRMPGVGSTACTWEGRHKVDVGAQFVCPMPECRYSMRLMNLSRWSTRNKTVTEVVTALRRMYENRQDASTQTDITMESMLVTIPRSLIQETPPPGGERGLVRRNSSSLVDRMVHRALSMDSLSRSYIPQQHVTWRSYAAMLGMHILQQVIHT